MACSTQKSALREKVGPRVRRGKLRVSIREWHGSKNPPRLRSVIGLREELCASAEGVWNGVAGITKRTIEKGLELERHQNFKPLPTVHGLASRLVYPDQQTWKNLPVVSSSPRILAPLLLTVLFECKGYEMFFCVWPIILIRYRLKLPYLALTLTTRLFYPDHLECSRVVPALSSSRSRQ
jgi:hypothetical protein